LIAAPVAGGNYAQDCSTYFFGARTARALVATRVTDNGMTGHAVSRADWLDPDGHRIDAVSIDRIAMPTLIVSWLMIKAATGATLGNRWTHARVINALAPEARGVPLSKIIIRHLVMLIGAVPLLAFYIVYAQGGLFRWLCLGASRVII
jgi:hypothetical protein